MSRLPTALVPVVGALVLAGCASSSAVPGAGCTDTWTGRGHDAEYATAANWSDDRVPTGTDRTPPCPPSTPAQPAPPGRSPTTRRPPIQIVA